MTILLRHLLHTYTRSNILNMFIKPNRRVKYVYFSVNMFLSTFYIVMLSLFLYIHPFFIYLEIFKFVWLTI